MARLSIALALIAFSFQHGALIHGVVALEDVVGTLSDSINAVFDHILAEAKDDFTQKNAPLKECGFEGAYPRGTCRRPLKSEPEEIRELLPYLLNDHEAMKLWRDHFERHVRDVVKAAGGDEDADAELHVPVLKTLGEREFWDSRPAVSNGAYEYLQLRMARLKTSVLERGGNPDLAVSWEAEVSPRFKYQSIKDAKRLMGTYLTSFTDPDKPSLPLGEPLPTKVFADFKPVEQENFDAREAFPECKDVIGHVRDQGVCGSCWAFASTEALNDRFCIKTGGKRREMLSPQHTTSCCDLLHCLSFGCNGGQPRMAWRWFSAQGVVTGGDFDELKKGRSCWPYEIPFCQHHSDGPFPKCDEANSKTPKCRKDCEEKDYSKAVRPFNQDLHYATTSYSVQGRDHVKRELMENGTVTGAFLVFEDFLMYKSGVYHHVSGGPLGGHAVKVIGFGNEDRREYWLAVNSWNQYWGDKGTFKIEMGEAGIDHEFCGGEPKVPEGDDRFLQQASQDL